MTRALRWGIAGTGDIACTTAPDLARTEGLELSGVASRHPERASDFAVTYGVRRSYRSYEEMFADPDIDVVYLATPISTHAALADQALRAGKHVLVEKAFATTAAEARTMADVAREQGRFLMEAMWMRFNPAVVRMLEDVATNAIGEVTTVQTGFGIPLPPGRNIWRPELGGGALLDMGVYGVTLAHLLLGRPQSVEATGDVRVDGLDVTSSVFLRYPEGRFAALTTSIAGFVNPVASIGGREGFIAFDHPFMSSDHYRLERPRRGEPSTVRVTLEGNGYVPMFRAVTEAIGDGLLEHPMRPLAETIDVLITMDQIRSHLVGSRGVQPSAAADPPVVPSQSEVSR